MDIKEKISSLVNSAFGKALASVIIAGLPIGSIIAIVLGSKGLKLQAEARDLAIQNGLEAGGKNVAAKVLGTIGKILGIVLTIIWPIYLVVIIAAAAAA